MAFKTCRAKNIDTVNHTYQGQELTPSQVYTILDSERIAWANDDDVLDDICDDKLQLGDGEDFLESHNDQINWLKDY